jgi:hypothetical protein
MSTIFPGGSGITISPQQTQTWIFNMGQPRLERHHNSAAPTDRIHGGFWPSGIF